MDITYTHTKHNCPLNRQESFWHWPFLLGYPSLLLLRFFQVFSLMVSPCLMLKVVPIHLATWASQPAKTPLGFLSRSGRFQCFSKLDSKNGDKTIILIWLVVEPYPSEKWWTSSVGLMKLPILESHSKFHGSKPPINHVIMFVYVYLKCCSNIGLILQQHILS